MKRDIWVDNVKVIACIFVVLGHFFQSMVRADIIRADHLYLWFIRTIYLFHVQLFFICSGYLFQKYSKKYSWAGNALRKFMDLGIPYFVFTSLTLVLKSAFNEYTNMAESGFLYTLLIEPTAPYWYLYVLFFIFLITPVCRSGKALYVCLFVALLLKMASPVLTSTFHLPYAVVGILNNEIWFASGMCLTRIEERKLIRQSSFYPLTAFIVLSVVTYALNLDNYYLNFLLSVIACFSILAVIRFLFRDNKQNKAFEVLAKYTLPIFLMHTIFAAGTRSILVKFHITGSALHIFFGLVASFVFPIIAAVVIEKIKPLGILLYPSKTIHEWKTRATTPS